MTLLPVPPSPPGTAPVTWVAPYPEYPDARQPVVNWLRLHGADPVPLPASWDFSDPATHPAIVDHPHFGELIVYLQYEPDGTGRRVAVQPLGMPPPPQLLELGRAIAVTNRLHLPLAALASAA